MMAHESATQEESYPFKGTLYMALELSKEKWGIRCSAGGCKAYDKTIAPNDEALMLAVLKRAKEKMGLAHMPS